MEVGKTGEICGHSLLFGYGEKLAIFLLLAMFKLYIYVKVNMLFYIYDYINTISFVYTKFLIKNNLKEKHEIFRNDD